jgi:hypothetical protein
MTNANTLATLEYEMAYHADGYQDAVRRLREDAARHFPADNLALARIATSAITDVKTNAGSQVVALVIKTNAAATTTGFVGLWNTSSASVTLGTTRPDQVIKLSDAPNVLKVVRFYPGSGATEFALALSVATTVTNSVNTTAANATNAPTITILYA